MESTLSTLAREDTLEVVLWARGGSPSRPVGPATQLVRGTKVEQWGLCVSCDRWFYCGTSPEQTRLCRCPACDQAPAAIREAWAV